MSIDENSRPLMAAAKLRQHAETLLNAKTVQQPKTRNSDDTQRLVHELEVHQIELEMQNAELRRARNEIESLLDKYTDLYDFAPVGYFTLDCNGVIRAVNLAGACLMGMERSRLVDRRFVPFLTNEVQPLFSDFLVKVFASRRTESCEITLKTEGNSPFFLQIEAVAFGDGKECRIAAIDITGRRQTEEELDEKRVELEELNCNLEARIARNVADLRSKDQMLLLQDRRAVMGEMINNIAHQWRQPLNALGLIVQQLPIFYGSAEFSREFLEKNASDSMDLIQHMSHTIDDFMNFFRSDKEMIAFGVTEIIEQTVSLIEKSFLEHSISIVITPEADPMVNGYPNEYAQVLLNILMNARDALLGGHVVNAGIVVRVCIEGSKSVVTISDNAGGIGEEIIDKIFDPYFTTKGPDKGTGIGLFMSKTIIEKNLGGKLAVRNTGVGAEFRIEV